MPQSSPAYRINPATRTTIQRIDPAVVDARQAYEAAEQALHDHEHTESTGPAWWATTMRLTREWIAAGDELDALRYGPRS